MTLSLESAPAVGESVIRTFESRRAADPLALRSVPLPPVGDPARVRVLAELVRIDLEFGWEAGAPRPLLDYLDEFPDLRDDPAALAGVAFEEYRQRLAHGHPARAADYRDLGVDPADWPGEGESEAASADPRTAVVDVAPSDSPASDSGTVTADAVADAAKAYRRFRSDPASLAASFPARAPAGRVFRDLHATNPGGAARLASGVAALPSPGDEFLGFKLVDELGRGAFARVFLAKQGDLADRRVALKVSATPSAESRTLAQLQHTNIVPIYSTHASRGLYAVCMPYFGATTLADVVGGLRKNGLPGSGAHVVSTLNNRKSVTRVESRAGPDSAVAPSTPGLPAPLPVPAGTRDILDKLAHYSYVEAVLWLTARVADGLAHAHARGVIHRDLKPANVLLTDEGQPMLLDFNLADDTAAGPAERVGGTLPYMAPEHLEAFRGAKTPVDARSDIYSLGLIAYELLTGAGPFAAPPGRIEVAVPVMVAQRRAGAPGLRGVNPAVSPAAAAIVAKCLAPDPAARYQTAGDLRDDLDRQLAHRPLRHAANPSVKERARKWARRNPKLVGGWAVGAVAAVLLAGTAGAGLAVADGTAADRAHRFHVRADTFKTRASHAFADGRVPEASVDETAAAQVRRDALAAVADLGRETLAITDAASDPAWASRRWVGLLSAADQDRLKADVADVRQLLAALTADAARPRGDGKPPGPGASAGECYAAAVDLVAANRFRDADPLLARAVEADPAHKPARFLLGVCRSKTGELSTAVAAYDVVLAFDPDHYPARVNRGLAFHRLTKYPAALADFTKAIALRPGEPAGHYNRALCKHAAGDHAGALADLDAAFATGAAPTRLFFLRSQVHAKLGNADAAARDLAAGMTHVPSDALGYQARAFARRAVEPVAAAADLRQAVKLDPDNPAHGTGLAAVLTDDLKDPKGAVAALDAVLVHSPEHGPALGGRAVLRARLGDRAGAHADAARALAADGNEAVTVYQVAGVYALTSKTHPADKALALRYLAAAFSAGGGVVDFVPTDADVDPLRNDPEFKELVAAAQQVRRRALGGAGK